MEDRVRQLGELLGPALGAPEQLTPRVRLAPYYHALIVEVDGEAWVLAEATVANKFAPSPAGSPMPLGDSPSNDSLPPRGGGLGRGGDSPSEVLNTLGQDVAPAPPAAADPAPPPPHPPPLPAPFADQRLVEGGESPPRRELLGSPQGRPELVAQLSHTILPFL